MSKCTGKTVPHQTKKKVQPNHLHKPIVNENSMLSMKNEERARAHGR